MLMEIVVQKHPWQLIYYGQKWETTQCLSASEEINEMWYTHEMQCQLARKGTK